MGPKRKWYQAKRSRDGRRATDGTGTADGMGDIADQHQQHDQQGSKKLRMSAMNIGQVKGHQAVVGTCDVRHDKAATAELVDLLNAFADEMLEHPKGTDTQGPWPEKASNGQNGPKTVCNDASLSAGLTMQSSVDSEQNLSVEDMIRKEADALRAGQGKSQRFMSVNTSVKGVIMVCVMDPRLDVRRLVDAIFADIRATGKRRSRFLERVTPIQITSFSEIGTFKTAAQPVVLNALPPVAEGVPSLSFDIAAKAVDCSQKVQETSDKNKESDAAVVADEAETTEKQSSSRGGVEKAVLQTATGLAHKEGSEGFTGSGESKAQINSEFFSGNDALGANGAKIEEQLTDVGDDKAGKGAAPEGDVCTKTCDKRWKFRVDVRRRNSGLKRMDLINAVVEAVGKGHSVSMASPDVSVQQLVFALHLVKLASFSIYPPWLSLPPCHANCSTLLWKEMAVFLYNLISFTSARLVTLMHLSCLGKLRALRAVFTMYSR